MADQSLNLLVRIKDEVSGALGKISGSVKGFTDLFFAAKTVVATFNAVIGTSIKEFAQFQTKMTDVGNLFGATKDEVKKLSAEVLKLSEDLPATSQDLANSLFDVISAGVPAGEALEFLEASSKLATAGVTDTKIAVDGMTSIMNAYGLSTKDATKISDALFNAQVLGKTTVAELSSAIGQVAPIASAAGISMEELLSAVSSLTTQGIKTSEAVTGTRAAITSMLAPSAEAKKLAASLGLEFSANALKSKGYEGVLREVIEATGGNSEALTILFGRIEAVNSVLALAKGEFASFSKAQTFIAENAGATEKAFKQQTDTMAAQYNILTDNIKSMSKAFIDDLEPAITGTLTAFNNFFLKVSDQREKDAAAYKEFAEEAKKIDESKLSRLEKWMAKAKLSAKEEKSIEETKLSEFGTLLFKKESLLTSLSEKTKKTNQDLVTDNKDKNDSILEQEKNKNEQQLKLKQAQVDALIKEVKGGKEKETTILADALEEYKFWLLEQKVSRDVSIQDEINALILLKEKYKENSEEIKKIDEEILKHRGELRLKNLKDQKEANALLLKEQEEINEIFLNKNMRFFKNISTSFKATFQDPMQASINFVIDNVNSLVDIIDQALFRGGLLGGGKLEESLASIERSREKKLRKLEKQKGLSESEKIQRYLDINLESQEAMLDLKDVISSAAQNALNPARQIEANRVGDINNKRIQDLGTFITELNKNLKDALEKENIKKDGVFHTGGIVRGANTSGDTIPARVNSGEMILNREQQSNLFRMAQSGSGGGGGGGATININGGIFMSDRTQAKQLARMIDEELVILGRQRQRVS